MVCTVMSANGDIWTVGIVNGIAISDVKFFHSPRETVVLNARRYADMSAKLQAFIRFVDAYGNWENFETKREVER
jgi:hypothetical protein